MVCNYALMGRPNGVFGGSTRALLLFGLCFACFLFGEAREATDTAGASATAVSLVHDHELAFDRYASTDLRAVEFRDGRAYDGFPVTTSFLLVPAVAVELALGVSPQHLADTGTTAGGATQAATAAALA